MKYAVYIALYLSCLAGAYLLGRSHAELKIVEKRVEVVKYVNAKKVEIRNKPNAGRDELLKLMYEGKL